MKNRDFLRTGVIGGGQHSRINHLPSLSRYAEEHGGIELTAFCDLDPAVAEATLNEYPFLASYLDYHEMLEKENLDACIAVTPLEATAAVSMDIMSAGIPLLMEKPPGRTLEEARNIREHAARTGATVMVSMNRRFDPALVAANAMRSGRLLRYIRAIQLRNNRREEDFLCSTGIHVVDAMRFLAGEVRSYQANVRKVEGVWWFQVQLEFANGAMGDLEVLPTCGCVAESYELAGPGYRIRTGTGEADRGIIEIWEDGTLVHADEPAKEEPLNVRNGSYSETCAFIDALKNEQRPWPSLDDVWPSVELCHRIYQEFCASTLP